MYRFKMALKWWCYIWLNGLLVEEWLSFVCFWKCASSALPKTILYKRFRFYFSSFFVVKLWECQIILFDRTDTSLFVHFIFELNKVSRDRSMNIQKLLIWPVLFDLFFRCIALKTWLFFLYLTSFVENKKDIRAVKIHGTVYSQPHSFVIN